MIPQIHYKPEPVLGFDVRASYMLTAAVDIVQTTQFKKLGISEMNPLADGFLHKGNTVFVIGAAASVYAIDRFIQGQEPENRRWMYAGMLAVESWAVLNNRKLGLKGLPVIVPVAKW